MSVPADKSVKSEAQGQSPFPASTNLVGVYGEQLFRILEQSSSGYVLLDAQDRAQRWNDGYLRLFPWLIPTLKVGASLRTALEAAVASAPPSASAELHSIAEKQLTLITRQQAHIQIQQPSGRKISLSAHALSANYTVLTCKELVADEGDGESLSFFDAPTNLPNRRLLLDRLSQSMIQSERTGWRGALLTIDMEPAKGFSHLDTDETNAQLAPETAQRLLSCMRACDTVARLDSKHFVIMVSDLSPDIELANLLVERLGERLIESLSSNYQLNTQTVKLEANIGATLFGPHSHSATELLQQAETAMYRLRDEEAPGLHFFNPEQHTQPLQRTHMEQSLREALRLSQFELHYQPQYSTRGDISGLEALLRWRHPLRGLVPPSIFLSVAEETGIILPLGLWSIRAACEQLAQWKSDPQLNALTICVNISAKQLQQSNLAEQIEHIIAQTGVNPALLVLELASKTLNPIDADIIRALSRLGAIGVRLSMDGFGSGSNTSEMLRQLPLCQLKLAHSLVHRLGPNNASEAAVQSAIALANQHQITVVGAGIETLEQRALLAQHGCKHFMGHLFSAPVPASKIKSLLQNPALLGQK
ncbi:bifunctional diguanylate cyclase/phosphodiesterase [Comamonas sp. Y33R10-2]|uniref:putative bifunctional diguanylate cyclase/phosphodiesterase n=1 Tax=Comamonas sp. Y33R10-2 TaxID=2853257 RepID=UPI001C5CB7A0|nr:bifunctional diguanylate cyclase/phosphodiesterase [Comamonas sp. Y33R10-2]QXZ10029.1 bifunctional diguanylate cyclase/phosphodiesterase [Comamonas sp. Y33R10-2]